MTVNPATVARPEPLPHAFRGVPPWFSVACLTAREGGASGYRQVGYRLAGHAAGWFKPDGLTDDEWSAQLDRLGGLVYRTQPNLMRINLTAWESEPVFAWIGEHFPEMLDLIPVNCRDRFMEGFWQGVNDGAIYLEA